MANYDYELAKRIINDLSDKDLIVEASLGMKEDWFWTAQTVWTKESGYDIELDNNTHIGGIKGSIWATPVIDIEFEDGQSKVFNCYTGQTADNLTKIEKSLNWANGCLSAPCQKDRDNIDVEDYIDESNQ